MKVRTGTPVFCVFLAACLTAQVPNPTQQSVEPSGGDKGPAPIFRVNVVARTVPAINYHYRQGSTNVGFRGTDLMPRAEGEARIESKGGTTQLQARFDKMDQPSRYGAEFLTYVLWAITPEGRAQNLGEVKIGNGDDANLRAATELQAFGMIVTAEPYYAVTQPSDVVVMENYVRQDTTGTIQQVNAKYELLQRGTYTAMLGSDRMDQLKKDRDTPIDLQEARNAMAIARKTGAESYAADTFRRAMVALQNAEGFHSSGRAEKRMQGLAREATQLAEDARIITLKKQEEERLAQERADAAAREAKAREKAQQEAEQRRLAEQQAAEADQQRLMAEKQRQQADQQRLQAEKDAAKAEAMAEIARQQQQQAEQEKMAALKAKQEADQARQQAEAAMQQAMQARQEAEDARKKLELEKSELRAQLRRSFESIMETRDSARGLIVNMSDVLFDVGKATLRQPTREMLAKVSGILISHPGLTLEIEGHTDSTGSEQLNQKLSEMRAASVRDYLATQGVPIPSMVIRGFGESQPIASNDTREGRQKNRRVEIVVSGDMIGTPSASPSSESASQ